MEHLTKYKIANRPNKSPISFELKRKIEAKHTKEKKFYGCYVGVRKNCV